MPGFCELPQYGLIGFKGDDAQSFLHSQLTCDVTALGEGRSVYGSYCTPKGRILATFLLWRSTEGYFMQLPAPLREAVQKRLTMFVLRSKVKVEDAGPRWTVVGVSGDGAASHVERVLGAVLAQEHSLAKAAGATIIRLPAGRYEILLPRAEAPAMVERLKQGTQPVGPEHWDWLDIRAGIASITAATQEQLVPQMVNLDLIGGLSFSKGCYPGQEIVARMHFLGRLKQRTYLAHLETGLATDEPPAPGDKLYSTDLAEQAAGVIVNAAPSPEGGYDVLAAIQISSAQGAGIHWKSPGGPPVTLLPLPYEVSASA